MFTLFRYVKCVYFQETASFQADESIEVPEPVEEDSMEESPVEENLPPGDASVTVTFHMEECGSKRCKPKLADSLGYTYTVKKRKPYATYWECSVRPRNARCPASVIQRNGEFRRGKNSHIHPPTVGATQALAVQAEVRQKATRDKFTSAGILVQEALMNTVDPEAPNQALPKITNLVSMHPGFTYYR